MNPERDAGDSRWFLGLGELLDNNAERQLGDLWQRLLGSVRNEEACAESARGPRTDWNPYRPARGRHLQQGILNSEVYEWRSKIPVDSLCVVGTAMPIYQPPPDSVANLASAAESHASLMSSSGANTTGDSARDQTVALVSGNCRTLYRADDSEADEEEGRGMNVAIPGGSAGDSNDSAMRELVDEVFDVLWRTIAVPWIMEQRAYHESQPNEEGKKTVAFQRCRDVKRRQSSSSCCCAIPTPGFPSGSTWGNRLLANRRCPTTGSALDHKKSSRQSLPKLLAEPNTHRHVVHRTTGLPLQRTLSRMEKLESEGPRKLFAVTGRAPHSKNKPALLNRRQPCSDKPRASIPTGRHKIPDVGCLEFKTPIVRKTPAQRSQWAPPSILNPRNGFAPVVRLPSKTKLISNITDGANKNLGSVYTSQLSHRKRQNSLKTGGMRVDTTVS